MIAWKQQREALAFQETSQLQEEESESVGQQIASGINSGDYKIDWTEQ